MRASASSSPGAAEFNAAGALAVCDRLDDDTEEPPGHTGVGWSKRAFASRSPSADECVAAGAIATDGSRSSRGFSLGSTERSSTAHDADRIERTSLHVDVAGCGSVIRTLSDWREVRREGRLHAKRNEGKLGQGSARQTASSWPPTPHGAASVAWGHRHRLTTVGHRANRPANGSRIASWMRSRCAATGDAAHARRQRPPSPELQPQSAVRIRRHSNGTDR